MTTKPPIHILFASRLVEEKGVDILIDCIAYTLSHPDLGIIWHICSYGAYQDEIIALQKKYPENIIYHGFVSPAGLAAIYRESDILFMPSRFLETFGLTALEALASGVHVIGFRKGGLVPFIPPNLALDHESPIDSFARMIRAIRLKAPPKKIDISPYQMPVWIEKFSELFPLDSHIALIHDYADHIGGAEIYLSEVMDRASHLGYSLSRFSFTYKTTPWKRRILFALSGLAFWRFFQVLYFCWSERPSVFWVHSILRYVGIWGVLAIRFYVNSTHSKIYLSHHDIGLIAPFPQDITDETQIPKNTSYTAFISGTKSYKKYLASLKWCYVRIIASLFPRNTEHIIFAPFLEMHIRAHFPDQKIHILPHAYDAEVYHP